MTSDRSPRLALIMSALPLRLGLRILEVRCGPGAAARDVAKRIGNGRVLGSDRSAKAIAQAIAGSESASASGRLTFRQLRLTGGAQR